MSTATLTRIVARTCPPWCARHITDPDGSILHEGTAKRVTAAVGFGMVAGTVDLKLNRYDEHGETGPVAVCITSSSDGVDLSAANLLQLAAAARSLAEQMEVGR